MHKILTLIRTNIAVQLALTIAIALFFGGVIPMPAKQALYALSLNIKSLLIFLLPFIIFSYLASCLLSLKRGAVTFILFLLLGVTLSNIFSILVAYLVQISGLLGGAITDGPGLSITDPLTPLWTIHMPPLLQNDWALFAGLFVGAFFTYVRMPAVEVAVNRMKQVADAFLTRFFIPILPLFILGFVLKLSHEGLLTPIFRDYGPVFVIIVLAQVLYLVLFYGFAANFRASEWTRYMKNVMPAVMAGFSTMSSAAAMPITLRAAQENTHGNELVKAIVPATLNIHLIGDSIGIPIMAMVIMAAFGHEPMSFMQYLEFTGYFLIAKFAIAAVPGGSIIVMVPILETHFGFTSEMSALITATYILFDPVITAANVSGNGAFTILFARMFKESPTPQPAM